MKKLKPYLEEHIQRIESQDIRMLLRGMATYTTDGAIDTLALYISELERKINNKA